MSLTTIALAKEAEASYQPILIATFQFYDGTLLRLSTHPLNVAEGGQQYNGHDYFARISDQALGAIQERSEQGIERLPTISLKLLDQDFFLSADYEQTLGFRDAACIINLIFCDTATWTFSSDAYNVFIGICDPPSMDEGGNMTVTASSTNNLQKKVLPPVLAQSRCPNTFPPDAVSRLAGGTDRDSLYFPCGYNPDQTGVDPDTFGDCKRGNLNAGVPFTDCDYTRAGCTARGMFTTDSSARVTARYAGIEWVPDNTIRNYINYGNGNKVPSFRLQNPSLAGSPIPLGWGTAWGAPIVANILGDGNYTRFEMIFNGGNVGDLFLGGGLGPILQVVMNGVTVPHNTGSTDPLNNGLRWDMVTAGRRSGAVTMDAGYGGQGDPYGSMAMLYAVLFVELAQSNAVPTANVLAQRCFVKQPNTTNPADVNGWPYSFSSNPAWVIADILLRCGLRWADLNIQTFITEAAWCDQAVSYIDLNGNSASHARYIIGLYIGQQRIGSEMVNAILRGFNAQLFRDKATGLVGIQVRKSIADQQPAAIDGSNYTTAILAINAAGSSGSGYPAYAFDETNTISIQMAMAPNATSGNRITIPIYDADNGYVLDTSIVTDTDDAARGVWANSGSVVPSNFTALGITSFDQAFRVSRTYLAEQLRGNEQQDTRGTRRYVIKTTFRIAHLRVGQIVLCRFAVKPNNLSSAVPLQSPPGTPISGFLARVIKIEGTKNFEQMTTTVEWTESPWYADAFGQSTPPQYSDPRKSPPNRPALPWHPASDYVRTYDDALFPSNSFFSVALSYVAQTDGSVKPAAQIIGAPTVNATSQLINPPLVGSQAFVANTGGFIPSGYYLYVVTAVDANGDETTVSAVATANIVAGVTTGQILLAIKSYSAGTVSFNVYGGFSEPRFSQQLNCPVGSLVSGNIVVNNLYLDGSGGPPDVNFDHYHLLGRKILKTGVWSAAISAIVEFHPGHTDDYVKLAIGATFSSSFAGRIVSKLASFASTDLNPAANFGVASSDGTYLKLTQTATSLTTDGIAFAVGDAVTIRAMANIASASTIGDALFVNSFVPAGLAVNGYIGAAIRIVGGTGKGQERSCLSNTSTTLTINGTWTTVPDATSVFIICEGHYPYDVECAKQITATSAVNTESPIGALILDNVAGGQAYFLEVLAEDANDGSFPDMYAPFREILVAGAGGAFAGYATVPLVGTTFQPDLANGPSQRIVLTTATATGTRPAVVTIASIAPPIWTGRAITAGLSITLYVDQDATGNWPIPVFTAGAGGYAEDVGADEISGTPSTRTAYLLTSHNVLGGGIVWALDSLPRTGGKIS